MNPSRMRRFAWAMFLFIAFGVFFTARYFCLSAVQAEQKFERPIYKTGVLVAKNPIFHELGGVGAPNAAGAMGAIPEDADHRGPHFSAPGDSPTEREALRLAKELRDNLKKTAGGSGSIDDESRQRLKRAVESAFEERQRQETAELQKLRQRLDAAQKKLSNREQLKQKIVDRRVEELLNPGVKWEEPQPAHRGDELSGGSRDAANENSRWSTPKPGEIRRLPNGVHMSTWSRRGQNHRDLAAAMLKYENAHKHFPPAAIRDKDQKPLLSWRVLLLPFLGEEQLYQEFRLNEPWDSAHNIKLLDRIPPAFRSTTTLPATKPHSTTILAPIGENTVFANPSGTAVREITEGTGKTVLLLDHSDDAAAVIWTKPEDWKVDAVNPRIGLVGSRHNSCTVIFCDGTTHSIDDTTPTAIVAAAFTFNSGDILPALPRIVSPEQTPPLNAAMFYVEINEAGKLVVGEQTVKAGKVWINKGRLITLERLRLELDAFPRGRRDDFYVILTPPRIFNAAVAKTQDEVLDLCDTMQIKSFVGIPKTSVPPSTADATPGIDPPRPISGTPPLTASPGVTPAGVPHQPHSDVKTKNEEAILKALGSTTTVAFVNTQLKDALLFLKDQHKINIYIDEGAFQEESIASDTPVNLQLSNLTLHSVLNLILKPLALGFTIEDEVLKITTNTRLGQTKQPDEIVQFGPRNPAIQQSQTQIARTLADPAIAAFVDTQLKDALMFLAKKHKIQIVIDDKALIAESIPTDTPVNLNLSDVSLRSILNLILKPSSLTFSIEDEVLKIKPRQLMVREASERVRKAQAAAPIPVTSALGKPTTEEARPARFSLRLPTEFAQAIKEEKDALRAWEAVLLAKFGDDNRRTPAEMEEAQPVLTAEITAKKKRLAAIIDEYQTQLSLLQILVSRAQLAVAEATRVNGRVQTLFNRMAILPEEAANAKQKLDTAQLGLKEAKALYDLYVKVGESAGVQPAASNKDAPKTPAPDFPKRP